nr:5462_t:CDS:2 [Entrophospora candida]
MLRIMIMDFVGQKLTLEKDTVKGHEANSTLKPPYTIQRYESIVPFKNYEEFNNDLNGEKEKWYVLDELEKDYTYETRVSYAATSPTDFILEIISLEDAARIIKARKGLNYLESNPNQITITNKRFLRVRAIYTGVSNVPQKESKPVIYNIVLETLTFGVPRVAFKLALVLGIAVGVGYYIFIPKIYESLLIHDMKNEISTEGCDPFLQASICYTKFWAGKWDGKPEHYKAISDTSCIVFTDSVKVDNLINMIPIVPTVDYTQLTQIARIFTALRKSFRSLVDYCAKLQPNSYDTISDTKIYFPFPTTFNDVSFTYTLYIKPLVLAAEAKNQKIIVKFVQRYNADAHNLCARENKSPNLLEVQDNVIFGWKIIIMESVNVKYLSYPLNMIKDLTTEEKSSIKGYIKHLINILHENDIVFGDLRPNNVLYDHDSRRISLIDFDWAGRHNVDKYPPFMNHPDDINWPQGVEEGKLMKKEHYANLYHYFQMYKIIDSF